MATHFPIRETIKALRRTDDPYSIGRAVGELLASIKGLVWMNMDHAADFRNKPPPCSIAADEFTAAVDAQLRHLRSKDGRSNKFPDDSDTDRKGRRDRRTYRDRYINLVRSWFKKSVRIEMGGWMETWDGAQNGRFNKGVDKALTGTAWSRYPVDNVCLQAGDASWADWLKKRCEKLGTEELKAGRYALDD